MPREPADPRLGRALRALRTEKKLRQEDIAYEAGITTSVLSRTERSLSNPTWTTVMRILDALEVSLPELAAAIEATDV